MMARIVTLDDASAELIDRLLPNKLIIELNRTQAKQFFDLLLDAKIYSPEHSGFAIDLRSELLELLGIEEL